MHVQHVRVCMHVCASVCVCVCVESIEALFYYLKYKAFTCTGVENLPAVILYVHIISVLPRNFSRLRVWMGGGMMKFFLKLPRPLSQKMC